MNLTGDNNVAIDVFFTDEELGIRLPGGRVMLTPLVLYPTLERARAEERSDVELLGDGGGIYWPALDLALSVEGVLAGRAERMPAPPARPNAARQVAVVEAADGWYVLAKLDYADHHARHADRRDALKQAAEWASAGRLSEFTITDRQGDKQVQQVLQAATQAG